MQLFIKNNITHTFLIINKNQGFSFILSLITIFSIFCGLDFRLFQTPSFFKKSVEFAFTASVRLSLGILFFLSITKTLNFFFD